MPSCGIAKQNKLWVIKFVQSSTVDDRKHLILTDETL